MGNFLNLTFLQILALAVNILVLIFLVVVFYLVRKGKIKLDNGKVSTDEKILKAAKLKSDSIITKAINIAQEIVSVSQTKRLNLFAAEKLIGAKIVANYKQDIAKLETEIQQKFEANTDEAKKAYEEFLTSVDNKIKVSLEANQDLLDTKATEYIDAANKSLTEFTVELEKRIKKQIEDEMNKAKSEIEEYKIRRRKVLDEKIVDIIEDVMKSTIDKKLTLADQSDFIFKALEEAKKNHVFE